MLSNYNRNSIGAYTKDSSIYSIFHGTSSLLLEDELNESQWNQIERNASVLREQFSSGFIKNYTVSTGYNNFFSITGLDSSPIPMLIDGYFLRVGNNGQGMSLPGGITRADNTLIFKLNTVGATTRTDLVILEAWFETIAFNELLTKFGGINSPTIANSMFDSRINAETSRRIQLRWRIRVIDNKSSMTGVTALKYDGTDSAISYSALGNIYSVDTGVQTLPDGSLKAPGIVYGLPLFTITRNATDMVSSGNITDISTKANLGTSQIVAGIGLSKDENTINIDDTGVSAGTYSIVTVNAQGQVTAGTSPTTISGYGITDALISTDGVPMISGGPDASKPNPETDGRLYVASDTKVIYRDNGDTWDTIGGGTANAVAWSNVTGKPTTISEFGITDAASAAHTHNLTVSGDVAGSVILDDTADAMNLTLATTGIAAGTYRSVTVDAKGRVTAGTNPTTLATYGIVDGVNNFEVSTTAVANKLLKLDSNSKLPASITGNADGNASTATKLVTGRTVALTGDVTGTSSAFDGSANISFAATLANSGVTAGTYPKVTVDVKGRVTAGTALIASDIPNLDWSKITTGKPASVAGYGITLVASDIPTLTLSKISDVGTAASKNTGTASGNVPILDSNGKLDTTILPALAITDTFVAANQAAMLALTAQVGDIAVRSDLSKSFILKINDPTVLANWQELLAPAGGVTSVAGKTGAVTLVSSDVGLGNVTNESKATMFTNAALTGVPTATTAAAATNTTQIATTAYVKSQNYLTGNQTVTISGDAVGSGTTAISLTLAASGVGAGTYRSVTVDAKGRVTGGSNPTTLAGYGIGDAQATHVLATTSMVLPVGANKYRS